MLYNKERKLNTKISMEKISRTSMGISFYEYDLGCSDVNNKDDMFDILDLDSIFKTYEQQR
jgi:hypothetical protein